MSDQFDSDVLKEIAGMLVVDGYDRHSAGMLVKAANEIADLRAQLAAEKENVRLQVADRIQLQHIINRRDTEIFDLKNAAEAEKESGEREAVLRQLDWAKETLNEHRRELHMNDEFPGEGTAMLEGVVNSLQRLAALTAPPDSGKGEEVTGAESESAKRHGEKWTCSLGTYYWNHRTTGWEKDKPAPLTGRSDG